jgi:hypothetical protein
MLAEGAIRVRRTTRAEAEFGPAVGNMIQGDDLGGEQRGMPRRPIDQRLSSRSA